MSLDAYHRAFVGYLSSGDSSELASHLEAPNQAQRLGVYLNTYAVGAIDALERHNPALNALMGTVAFRDLARGYVAQHPPRHRSLSVYGADFADFVDEHVRDEANQRTYCTDLVRLDSAWTDVYFAAEPGEGSAGVEDLSTLEERLEVQLFTLSDTAARIETQWRVLSLWAKLRELTPDQAGALEGTDTDTNIESGTEFVLLFREGAQMRYQPLSEAENAFTAAFESGSTLINAGQQASDADALGTYDLAASVSQFFTHRLLKIK